MNWIAGKIKENIDHLKYIEANKDVAWLIDSINKIAHEPGVIIQDIWEILEQVKEGLIDLK
jgi:hypothetical protein